MVTKRLLLSCLLWVALVLPLHGQESFDLSALSGGTDAELVKVRSLIASTATTPGSTVEAAVVVEIAEHWHINSAKPYESYLIAAKVQFDTLPGITPRTIRYPAGQDAELMGEKMSVYEGQTTIRFKIDVAETVAEGDYTVPVRFTYQPCDNKECRAPQTVAVDLAMTVGSGGTSTHSDIFGAAATQPPVAASTPPVSGTPEQENDLQRLIDEHGFWGYFLALGLAFITGVLLSFSPCTYPMIPITVSVFAGRERSVGKGFMMSLLYVVSMAVVYGIMGLIVSLVGGVFGAWLASPPVVIGIVVVFVIFALSMFGLYELQVPASLRNKLGRTSGGGGIGSAIVLGIVAALVVSPCVGPFVAGILLYIATAGSPVVGFLVLFVFALGLGTLYIIIGTFSSAISALPGSGGWMESVKKFFGFVLLLMAVYFVSTIISPELTAIATGVILLVLGVFGGGLDRLTPEAGFFLRLKKLIGVVALLVAIYLLGGTILRSGLILPPASEWLPTGVASSETVEKNLIPWSTDLEGALQQAKADGRPVLIDTWATWCVNCKILEKKTLNHPSVVEAAARFQPIKVQLENSGTAITQAFMARFGLKHYSLPTTLLLDSSGNVHKIISGVVSPEEMIAALQTVN